MPIASGIANESIEVTPCNEHTIAMEIIAVTVVAVVIIERESV